MTRWIAFVAGALCAYPFAGSAQERPFELTGLVVTASPSPRPAQAVARSVTILEGAELRARGLTRVVDALRDVSGLSVVAGGSFGSTTSVFMRGGESDYVQVLIDGVQVNQPGGAFDFAGLTLANVERIEVVRGPASSLYGSDAMAGVIQIITRTGGGSPEGDVSVRFGSFAWREASATVSGGGGTAAWSMGIMSLATSGTLPFNNDHSNTVVTANVRLTPNESTRGSVALRLGSRRFGFPTNGAGEVVDQNAFTFGDEASVAVSGSRALNGRVEVQSRLTLAQTDGGTDDQADAPSDTLGFFGFTSLDHVQRAAADFRINVGLGGSTGTLGMEFEDQSQRAFSETASEWGVTPGRSEYQRGNRAGYVHLAGAAGRLSYGAGGRVEDNESFGRSGSWNVESAWALSDATRLRASAGSALKEPTFYENFAQGWVRGNPDLVPERALAWDVGFEQRVAGDRGRVGVTWFDQTFRDLIEYTASPPQPTDPNFVNVARARARGLELSAETRVGAAWLGAEWTWLETAVLDAGPAQAPGADFVVGDRLLRRPDHTLNVHARLALGSAFIRGDVRIVGQRDDRDFSTYPAQRVRLPQYTTVNLAMEAPAWSGVVLSVRGENLLNAAYQEALGYPAPGRGVYVGARVVVGG